MGPTRTKTVKNKHAASKTSSSGGGGGKKSATDGVSKPRKPSKNKGTPPSQQLKEKSRAALLKKPKRKTYSEDELGIPKLNMITPVGVVKPRGKKKGKIFVDDRESMNTIMSMVQAEKNGQIESKMIKARQMEEIREARKVEAEKKDEERKSKLEETKDGLRKKRKRRNAENEDSVTDVTSTGTKPLKFKKRVSFA